ncbi:MAG TPA: hypothetical protein VGM06_12280 [Polyangiaceae bacterium]|jgi:hypothetical protein
MKKTTKSRRSVPVIRRACLGALAALAAIGAATGCAREERRTASYPLVIRVESQPGQPVPGASVSFQGRSVGRTDDAGTVTLSVRGAEGEHVTIGIRCPEGFVATGKAADVVLHALEDPTRKPEYDVECRPLRRTIVVVVRADRGPNLPVMYLGREVARTDDSGAAHALLDVPASEDVEISLSTVDAANQRLRPQNPSMKFFASDPSDLKVFSVPFQVEPEARLYRSERRLPIRIN